MSKVSVIMPVYNGGVYLEPAIESILAQTYRDFEFIAVDDGSSDDTISVLDRFSSDSRLQIVRNEYNMGLACSLNIALELAGGVYVARQDADDMSHPERLAQQVRVLDDRHEVALVASFSEIVDGNGVKLGEHRPPTERSEQLCLFARYESPFAHGSVMFRKDEVVSCGGYDERFWYAQDFDLWLRMMRREERLMVCVKAPLYSLRRLPPQSRFKAMCQRRYAEIALKQFESGAVLEFDDVRQWVARKYPDSRNTDNYSTGEYWLFMSLTAMQNGYPELARSYALRAIACKDMRIGLRATWRILLSWIPQNWATALQRKLKGGLAN